MARRTSINEDTIWLLDAQAFRKEISRLSAIANKRMKRLENRDWADSPALKTLKNEGIAKFSVKGKTHQEVQNMAGRLLKFLKAETSTITGATNNAKEIANITGITYNSVKDLKVKMKKFFEVQSKITQYLKSQGEIAAALDYRQIWNSINHYVKEQEIDLSDAKTSVDELLAEVESILEVSKGRMYEPFFLDPKFIVIG